MIQICETNNFVVIATEAPLVDRLDGGHILIFPKEDILDRTEMTDDQATEFIKLTMVIGKAMEIGMSNIGVEIMRINYQDMGNWAFKRGKKPRFHLHVFGRAKNAKFQPYKEAIKLPDKSTGFYNKLSPLEKGDISEIKSQIKRIVAENNYTNFSDTLWVRLANEPDKLRNSGVKRAIAS